MPCGMAAVSSRITAKRQDGTASIQLNAIPHWRNVAMLYRKDAVLQANGGMIHDRYRYKGKRHG